MQISFNLVWKEKDEKKNSSLEMPGIEPGAFHMQSERATTALHPLLIYLCQKHLQL